MELNNKDTAHGEDGKNMPPKENPDQTPATNEAVKPPSKKKTAQPLKAWFADGKVSLNIDTRTDLENLLASTGSTDGDFGAVLLDQVLHAANFSSGQEPGHKIQEKSNCVLAAMSQIQPQDAIEGMLAAQLVAVHHHAMHFLRLSTIAENIAQPELLRRLINLSTRLSRTYGQLVETLGRHRRQAEQTVRVEHVHVHPGGQAIVGHVEHHAQGGSGQKNG
jgi:hypothetical protein